MTATRFRSFIAAGVAFVAVFFWVWTGLWWIGLPPFAFGAWGYWWSRHRGETLDAAVTLASLYVTGLSGFLVVFLLLSFWWY